jgi:peptidoglycan hydrolase CwlO-like protein
MKINGKKILFLPLGLITFLIIGRFSILLAQESCDSTCDPHDSSCLGKLVDLCTGQVSQLQSQTKTLKNQIAQFDYQIKLTTLKIQDTQDKIALLGGRIDQLEVSLNDLTNAFSSRAVETYKMSRVENSLAFLLSATDLDSAVARFHYLQKIQEADRSLLEKLQEAQTTYQGQKTDQETLQKQLTVQQANLDLQKKSKANLLSQTQGSESKYQSILSEAQAALAALSNFAESVGISIIPHQDLSDGWGKYYNQRDANWGNMLINGQGSSCGGACTLASVGCLVTSYAMVTSHFGGSLTPGDVAMNSVNFWPTTALFNTPGPSANGHGATSVDHPSIQELKDSLNSNSNTAIIAGLSKDGGPWADHWVVLRSVDGDSFKINDPLYAGAMNTRLSDHYSGWSVVSARIYN